MHPDNDSPNDCLSREDIETIVEEILDRKLAPVIAKLPRPENPDQGPALDDILGGLGYILGLVGVGAYFHYRRKITK